MGNYSNIPIGLRIPTQIPLNAKENIADEATLKDLGINDNLAFTYEKGLIIYCKLEGTRYEWREVLSGEELTGLRDTDYIYPNGVITNDVDYSNKKYNFFTIENNTSNIFIEEGDNIVIDGNGSNVTPYIISGLSSPFNSVNNSYFPRNRNESQFGDIGQFSYDFSFAEIGANGEPEGQIGQNGVQPDELYGSLGNLTYTFGYNLSAQGYNDSLFGRYNHSGLQSEYSTILGRNNYNNSKNSLLSGSYNKIIYNILGNSTVFGQGNIINGAAGLTSGVSLLNKSFGTTVLGQANTDYTDTSEDINEALSPILIVGNGNIATPDGIWTSTLRSDALKLLKNGLLTLPSVTNDLIENDVTGKAVVTKEYLETVFPNTPDGSETKIIPGTNIGITGNGTTLTPYVISSNNDDISQYTNEMAQDAVGSILQNSDTIEFVYDDDNNTIHANLKGEAYRFITKTGFILVDNVITINPLNVWLINNIEYSNPLSIELTIPYSTSGNQRIIYIVPNNTNSFDIISGEESVSIPGAPTLEFPDLYLTFYLVTDGTVGETVLPNYNDLFLKRYKLTYKTSQSDFNLEPGEDDYNVIFTGTTNSSINIFPNGSYGKYIRNGAIYPFKNMGTGVVSIWSGIGVTVNAPNGLILNPNHQCYIIKDDWNEWTVINPPSDLGKEITSNKISSITGYSTTLYPNEKATHDALDLKLNISDLPTNLTLYPTTTASDVSGYVVMVKDIHDVRYNSTAVDVSTPTITGVGQLISQRISDAGVLMGQPGVFNITTFGNIRHLSGSGTATFYFEVYHRDAAGVETLICTSSTSEPVVDGGYSEFTASGLWDDGDFVATDRIVIKSYANRIAGGSDPVYQFQFGGASPVRTLLPVPFSVVDAGYELRANKQNDLTPDGTGTKYPTVDAVNTIDLQKVIDVGGYAEIISTNQTGYASLLYDYDGEEDLEFKITIRDNVNLDTKATLRAEYGRAEMSSINGMSGKSAAIQVESGIARITQRNAIHTTNIVVDDPLESTTLNFPAKTVAGTYTLATTDEVNAIDLQKVVDVNGYATITGTGSKYGAFYLDETGASMFGSNSTGNNYSEVGVDNGRVIFSSQYLTKKTSITFDNAIEDTSLNFPAKTVAGTYTLATTDDISTLDSNMVHKAGDETITGSKTFQTDTSSPSVTILNGSTNPHPAQKIYNFGPGNGLEIDFTTGTGDAIAVFNSGTKTLFLSKEGDISSNSNYIKSSLKLLNSDADLYGDISLNLDRYLFNNKSGNLQFLTQNSGFITYKSPTISGTFSNANLTESRTFTLPDATGTIPIISQTITNGVTDKSPSEDVLYDALALKVEGSGTTGYLPKFTSSGSVGNSLIYDNGTNVGIGTLSPLTKFHVTGLQTYQGTTASDTAPLGTELATTGSGSGWIGTSFTTGYAHTTGDTTALTTTITPTVGGFYQLAWVITGRTAGTVQIQFGDYIIGTSTSGGIAPIIQTTTPLTISPTTTFDGTITFSIKSIGTSSAVSQITNSSGTAHIEARTSLSNSNMFIGLNSGRRSTAGIQNTALGAQAGKDITSGNNNTAVGNNALAQTTTGGGNTSVGHWALRLNVVGGSNTAVGSLALSNNIGSNNTGIGIQSLLNNTSGYSNTAVGYLSLYSILGSSNQNTAIGNNAGRFISGLLPLTTCSNSIFIGESAKALVDNSLNETVIGYSQTGLGSNSTIIGGVGNTKTAIVGRLLLGTTVDDGVNQLQVNGNITASVATTSNQVVVKSQLDAIRPYKVYTALLSQTGTNAPTATVLENTLGGTIVWSRSSTGIYIGTLSGAFTVNKTLTLMNTGYNVNGFEGINRVDVNSVQIQTYLNGPTYADGRLANSGSSIEIRVYN